MGDREQAAMQEAAAEISYLLHRCKVRLGTEASINTPCLSSARAELRCLGLGLKDAWVGTPGEASSALMHSGQPRV